MPDKGKIEIGVSFIQVMLDEFQKRQARNPAYTLSSFARDLEMSPQKLGQILNRKSGMSAEAASRVASKMKLDPTQTSIFLALVEAKHARNSIQRVSAAQRAHRLLSLQDTSQTVSEEIKFDSWGQWVLMLLFDLKDFEPSIDWVATKLGVENRVAERLVEQGISLGQLVEAPDSGWMLAPHLKTHGNRFRAQPDDIRKFRADRLVRASAHRAFEQVSEEEAVVEIAMLPIRSDDLELIRRKVDRFFADLLKEFHSDKSSFRPSLLIFFQWLSS